ncbi:MULTISPECIES: MBL fold metallo-hydrolase [unclassified Brevundimonas]|uniref:MBL fold metallo-hydrolase n=1 Tax=unclassified Brevundimonas TaxID=2622653 RepID=UPI000CFBB17D|nr:MULTISPECIES: MBL fold metallo-hydrolase [unclassified Brevundimonas]PRA33306.1 MBL fold metallo-hydrolase [Brevundimonas sp. MYb27]PQZ83855.1 MBL fold metallo-hydrolase [Brevundimonas sp. MYb31]PRB13784.1 MBL fold metallo-hydrolase [Brevundimonas sp. MYb52]PRB34483.1 MBL fold metallo-hydrolase [Brevundimonas sp. MYb46]PRB53961.1 MBL fold metallo-hydrolase [Brevundimonas sp. MYb33]
MIQSAPHSPHVVGVFDPATHTVSYVVADPTKGAAAIIDPVLDFDSAAARTSTGSVERLLALIAEKGWRLDRVLETHAHADHLTGADEIRVRTGAPIGIGEHIKQVQKTFGDLFEASDVSPDASVFDQTFADGDCFLLGELEVEVLHTPGHTPACVSYRIGDAVFVGDTLFMPDYGTARCDFPGGDARTLHRSIQKLLALPDATRVFVGHDYLSQGRETFAWETTIGAQKAGNIHIGGGRSEDDFVALREARDATLSPPQLILTALQVNIRAGALPPSASSGRRFLKTPLNAI